ncbi:MAG: PorT family protein [Bacteroidetes bacterium]|jgi:opacity protein-like surface antigen|uniref:PorT family protein n=1 Tax=Candidatus Cryptobacteroides avicola TaxID=2840757 RepID=A0A940DSJ0_9BACT|nr:PorT family protein [Candidatus Cryptobacteroides avicola]
MKKIYIILAAAVLFMCLPTRADAQHFGVKAGVNFSDPKADVKTNMGYQAGIAVQCDLPLWFSIQPELLFHVKGGQASASSDAGSRAFGLGYLEIPVNIQWGPRFSDDRFRIFVQGSPFIGYAISKDMKNAKGEAYDWKNINRFEYGLGAGLGIQLWRHFQITGQYNWSLGNLVNSGFAEDEFKKVFDESNFSGYTISLAIIF